MEIMLTYRFYSLELVCFAEASSCRQIFYLKIVLLENYGAGTHSSAVLSRLSKYQYYVYSGQGGGTIRTIQAELSELYPPSGRCTYTQNPCIFTDYEYNLVMRFLLIMNIPVKNKVRTFRLCSINKTLHTYKLAQYC